MSGVLDGKVARQRRRAASGARSRSSSPPRAAMSPPTTTTAPPRPRRCAPRSVPSVGAPWRSRRASVFRERRRTLRRVREALRPGSTSWSAMPPAAFSADHRDDAQALALVHGNQCAGAEPAHAARAAADEGRRAHRRALQPRFGARDAGLRLHRRVKAARGPRARARAGARPRGIRVNTVSAGVVDTDALACFPNRDEVLANYAARTPAGRC